MLIAAFQTSIAEEKLSSENAGDPSALGSEELELGWFARRQRLPPQSRAMIASPEESEPLLRGRSLYRRGIIRSAFSSNRNDPDFLEEQGEDGLKGGLAPRVS